MTLGTGGIFSEMRDFYIYLNIHNIQNSAPPLVLMKQFSIYHKEILLSMENLYNL